MSSETQIGVSTEPISRRQFLRAGGMTAGALAIGALGAPAAWAAPTGGAADDFDAEVPTAWFDLALGLVEKTGGYSPPVASRALAYTGLALYESIVPGMPGYSSLGGVLTGLGRLPSAGRSSHHWPLVANAAMAATLRSLFSTAAPEQLARIGRLEGRFSRQFQRTVPVRVAARSRERGYRISRILFEWSKGDGGHEGFLRNFPTDYVPPVAAGSWVPTPEAYLPALQPYWGSNRTFAIPSGAACPAIAHTPYSEHPASLFFAEAMEVYEAVNNVTPEQEAIARFWADDPGSTPTPPGHSVSIATQILRLEDASLALAAETYAKVGIGTADAFIACWWTKYTTNLLRPVTYVRQVMQPDWLPLLNTPPFPEYTSGHSVQSGAAFQVLADLFGDDYPFTDDTHAGRGLEPRSFASFSEAADEAAISRLYGGIHYRPGIDNGVDQGRCIGRAVSALPFTG